MSSEMWAALIGALVGGLISGGAAWWTAKTQWDRERRERRMERLEDAVESAIGELTTIWNALDDEESSVVIPIGLAKDLHVLTLRAHQLSPHLGEMLEIEDDEQAFVAGGVAVPPETATRLAAVLLHWLQNPARYEKDRPSCEASLVEFEAVT